MNVDLVPPISNSAMIKIYIYTWPFITCDSTEVLHTSFHPQIDLSKDLSVNQIDLSSGSNLQREFYNWQEMEFSVRKKISSAVNFLGTFSFQRPS